MHHSAVIAFWHLAHAVKWNEFHLTDRDFFASNLKEWINSLVSKMSADVASSGSLLTILSHVIGCGDAEQSTIKCIFLLLADLTKFKACSWNMLLDSWTCWPVDS